MTGTQVLAELICATPQSSVSGARALAEMSLLDTLCAQYAASGSTINDVLGRVLDRYIFPIGGQGSSEVPSLRAFHDGCGAAAEGLDDRADYGAAGAVIWPALLTAVPDSDDFDANDLLDAFWIGILTAEAVFRAGRYREADRGFDGTVVFGTIASTAAILRFQHRDVARAMAALSISTSMIGGLVANLGSDMDAVHAGLAAMNGVRGVALANEGLRGAPDILEARQGFNEAFFGAGLCSALDLAESVSISLSRPPSLRFRSVPGHIDNQEIISAVARTMREAQIDYREVISLEIDGISPTSGGVRFDVPATDAEARASLRYMAARTLLSDGNDLPLGMYPVGNARTTEAMAKVTLGVMSRWDSRLAEVDGPALCGTITLTNHSRLDVVIDASTPFNADRVVEKWEQIGTGLALAGHPSNASAIFGLTDAWKSSVGDERASALIEYCAVDRA